MIQERDIAEMSTEIASGSPVRDADAERERSVHRISRVEQQGPYYRVWVDVPPSWRRRHQLPGQYITARFGATRHRFLVIANAPERAEREGFELLVEPNVDLAPVLDSLTEGSEITVSVPEGPGFPVHLNQKAILFATGSGVAGIRPVLQRWADHPEQRPESVVLFYEEGEGTPHAYRHELNQWSEEGWLELRLSVVTEAVGGRLEKTFGESGMEPASASALLCGSPAMIGAVTAELLRGGIDPEDVHTNL